MNDGPGRKNPTFAEQIGAKAARKGRARKSTQGVWFGLGLMGLIGWSVAIPTLLGVALGMWVDKHYASSHSWTLALMIAGLALGCFNAWRWVDHQIREEEENDDD